MAFRANKTRKPTSQILDLGPFNKYTSPEARFQGFGPIFPLSAKGRRGARMGTLPMSLSFGHVFR
jgi:hypothetical protein